MKTEKKEDERVFKVGIAIPCHVNDKKLLPVCLQAVENLDPPPHTYLVDLNKGEGGLRGIRTRLFNKLFETCDVILQCDVDYYLFPDILSYVRKGKVTNFCHLTQSFGDVFKTIARFVSRNPWTGCYSLPKAVWQRIKMSYEWDGTDTSVKKIVSDYVFIYTPKYYLLRRSPRRIQVALSDKSLFNRTKDLLLRGIL